jgi:hypothetical protein
MVSADCEATSASRIRRTSESSTWLKATVFASMINLTIYGIKRPRIGNLDDPFVKTELLAFRPVCEEIADYIELTGGEDHAPRGPLSRLS